MTTTPPRRASLEGAFAAKTPPDRAESLRGLLPPRTKSEHRPAEPVAAPAVPEQAAPARATRPRRTSNTGAAAETSPSEPSPAGADETTVNMPAYLPPELLAWVRAEIRTRDVTYADVLFDAFEVVDDAELVEAFTPHQRTGAGGVPRRTSKIRGDGGVQRQFRVSLTQRDWVDTKITEVGAPSRSALCAAVLEHYRVHLAVSRQ